MLLVQEAEPTLPASPPLVGRPMRVLVATAFVLVSSLVRAEHEVGHGVIVVNAPDGPMLETREEILRLRQEDVTSISVRLENVEQIQDDELMELIEAELTDLLVGNGFGADSIAFERCPQSCE